MRKQQVKRELEQMLICQCGCGQEIPTNKYHKKKQPRFLPNHHPRIKKDREYFINRFWGRVKKSEDCWEWTGFLNYNGYGKTNCQGKVVYTHRFSYEIHKGEIPEGMYVCHTCDNRKCVNPDHLFLGTPKDNVDDMMRKGRQSPLKGSPKLTEVQVLEILKDTRRVVDIARDYGVQRAAIYKIKSRQRWKNLCEE